MINCNKVILITDGNHRKSLAAARTLGLNGFQVIAADKTRLNISGLSKYCSRTFVYPDPFIQSEDFINYLYDFVCKNKVDVLFPMDDITAELFSRYLEMFKENVVIPIPDYKTFSIGRNKELTLKKATEMGMPCPRTYFIDNLDQVKDLSDKVEYPAVIKPKISSGSRGITYVYTKKELVYKYHAVHREFPYPLLQEYIPLKGRKQLQVLLLIDKNKEIKACCTQEFIRQYPVTGGPGTLWKTISLPNIEKISAQFLQQIGWYGIACMEYITDPRTGEVKFMELNPRFWGTLNLSIQVGVNFPLLLAKMALGVNFDPVYNTRFEEYCQWLLPGDLLNFIFNKERFKQEVGYFFRKPKKFYHVTLSRDDPLPVYGTILKLLMDVFRIESLKNIFKRGK